MSGFVLDASAVALLAPGRLDAGASAWLRAQADALHVSSVTIATLRGELGALVRRGEMARAGRLASWLDALLAVEDGRILPFDIAAAMEAGLLAERARVAGIPAGFEDIAVAATASRRRMVLLSAHGRRFGPLGIECRDPREMQVAARGGMSEGDDEG